MQDAAQPGANTVFMGPKANVALSTLCHSSCSCFTPTLIADFHPALFVLQMLITEQNISPLGQRNTVIFH